MIMGEFHMIPLKINNYNHMKLSWQLRFGTQDDDYRFAANM